MSTLEVTDLPVPAKDTRFPSTNQALNCWCVQSAGWDMSVHVCMCTDASGVHRPRPFLLRSTSLCYHRRQSGWEEELEEHAIWVDMRGDWVEID